MKEINDLKFRLNEKISQLKSLEIKNNHLQELINYYETNKNNIEELMIQMSNYMRNIIVKQLIKDLIKNNYDLIELGKEISLKDNDIETENIHKRDIENKLKEMFYIIEKLKKELQLEERLYKIQSNFPYNPCITKTMNEDLEESKNNLKDSFSYYSSNLNK
jgi:ribosomal protein S17E